MKKVNAINGWTKRSIIEKINTEFKGQARDENDKCYYKMADGRKCAVGIFLPEDHPATKVFGLVDGLLFLHEDLKEKMPLETCVMREMQKYHDQKLNEFVGVAAQKAALIKWVEEHVYT